jgi:hypothetical protein
VGLSQLAEGELILVLVTVAAMSMGTGWALGRGEDRDRPVQGLRASETPEESLRRLQARGSASAAVQRPVLPPEVTGLDPRIMEVQDRL